MSEGLYSHTTRGIGTVLTAAIYNADHNNHITNANPLQHGAYSDDIAQMRLTTDPGGSGSEILADSLAGELARLRFAIKRITGTDYWYEAPATSLGLIGGGLPLTLAFAETPLALRRTENNTTEYEIQSWGAGSGVGNKFSRRIVGTGSNAAAELRDYLGTTELQRLTATLKTIFIAIEQRSYTDIKEITIPAAPAATFGRLYAKVVSGVTRLFYRRASGNEVMVGARNRVYDTNTSHTTLTNTTPLDDTTPASSEGTQVLNGSITLMNVDGQVKLSVNMSVSADANVHVIASVFRGSVCIGARAVAVNDTMQTLSFELEDTPGSAGPHSYTVRVGPSTAANVYLNGSGATGNRLFGGVSKATFTIEELPI
jgi:hypothetical protein